MLDLKTVLNSVESSIKNQVNYVAMKRRTESDFIGTTCTYPVVV
jgi:hypothetical protein